MKFRKGQKVVLLVDKKTYAGSPQNLIKAGAIGTLAHLFVPSVRGPSYFFHCVDFDKKEDSEGRISYSRVAVSPDEISRK